MRISDWSSDVCSSDLRSMLDELSFKGFMGRDERMRDWAARQRSLPQVIFVSGYMTPKDIARQVPHQYFQKVSKGVYIARLPIDVRPGATWLSWLRNAPQSPAERNILRSEEHTSELKSLMRN